MLVAALAVIMTPWHAPSQAANGATGRDTVVAEVDGAKITLQQFEDTRPLALFPARNTFYETERKAIDTFLDDYLLQTQAQKEGISVAELLRRHVDSQIGADPSEDALRVYYEGLDTRESFDAVRKQILDNVRLKRTARAKAAYVISLREAAKVVLTVKPPRAPISLRDTPLKGDANAPLTLVEYADYECPYCQLAEPDLKRLEADYAGKIAIAFKDLPLPMHAHAQKAAEAALCAGSQGKYWEYHDLLFKTKALELPELKTAAKELALDTKLFDACLDSGARADAIKAVLDEAQALGLQGTPSFFVNGRFLNGMPKYEQLRQMVDEELKQSAAGKLAAAR